VHRVAPMAAGGGMEQWWKRARASRGGQRCLNSDVPASSRPKDGRECLGARARRTTEQGPPVHGVLVRSARFSGRSRGSRHREASGGLGKARPTSGTCAEAAAARGVLAGATSRRSRALALPVSD
jgi:hypothetical protein